MRTIVMTGAGGGVAQMLRPILRERYHVVLSDRTPIGPLEANESEVTADLLDRHALGELVRGADGVVHLGGQSTEADWETVKAPNIDGLFNILSACNDAGVERFVFASSNHAAGFYPRTRKIGIDEAVRPDGLYGVSKAFGEALCSLFADKHGMRIMSIRIGNVGPKPADLRRLSIWLHPEDLAQQIDIAMTHPDLHHAIVYGASHNERAWWDNGTAFALGYDPKHSAEDHRDFALGEQAKLADDPVGDKLQGGTFCSSGFSGDFDRTYRARLPR